MSETLLEQIKRHEGFRSTVYKCTAGRNTVGYGRNLDDCGINEDEAEFLLVNDINRCRQELSHLDWFILQPKVIQSVLINMAFQLGIKGISKFRGMIQALSVRNYPDAAKCMLDSLWAKQTPNRAQELAEIIRDYAIRTSQE